MRARILIIEDDEPSLTLATFLLRSSDHEVLAARNGNEGVERALEARTDLILCDLQIPFRDGYAIARLLRASPQWRRVPIVALTALSMPGDRERAIKSGFDDYLTKPITPETFVAQIESLIGHHTTPQDP